MIEEYIQPTKGQYGYDERGIFLNVYVFYKHYNDQKGRDIGIDDRKKMNRARYLVEYKCTGSSNTNETIISFGALKNTSQNRLRIKVYKNTDVIIRCQVDKADGNNSNGRNKGKFKDHGSEIQILWDDLKKSVDDGKTFLVRFSGDAYQTKKQTSYKDDRLPIYLTSNLTAKGRELDQENSRIAKDRLADIDDINNTYQNETSINIESLCVTFQSFYNWCSDVNEMNHPKCKSIVEQMPASKRTAHCKIKENIPTNICKTYCSPDKCDTGFKDYCSKFTSLKEFEKATIEDKNICACYLPESLYEEYKQPFIQNGIPASSFTDRKCFFGSCANSSFGVQSNESCPSIVNCINNLNVQGNTKIEDNSAIKMINQCSIDSNEDIEVKQEDAGDDEDEEEEDDNATFNYNEFVEKNKVLLLSGAGIVVLLLLLIISSSGRRRRYNY